MKEKQTKVATIQARITSRDKAKLGELVAEHGTTESEVLRKIIKGNLPIKPRAKKGSVTKHRKKDTSPGEIYYQMSQPLITGKVEADKISLMARIYADLITPSIKGDEFHCSLKSDVLRITICGCWRSGKTNFADIISTLTMMPMLRNIVKNFPEGIIDYSEPAWVLDDITDEILADLGFPQPPKPQLIPEQEQPEITFKGEGI